MSIMFKNIEERTKYSNISFIEIQFCKMSDSKSIKKKVAVGNMKYHSFDSLYIHYADMDKFLSEYREVFINGSYNNQKTGYIDPYGINYYQKEQIYNFIKSIVENKPKDYEIIIK